MTSDLPVAPIVMSTDMLPERERFDAWRESFALRLVRVDVTTPDRAAFRAAMGMLPLDRLSLVTCNVSAVGLTRTKQLVHDGNDDLCLVICTTGTARLQFGDTVLTLEPGDATIVPSYRIGGVTTTAETATLSLRLPRALLRELIGPREPPSLRLIPRHDPRLRLLLNYARQLATAGDPLQLSTARLAGRHLAELAAHLLAPTADCVRAERFGGVRAARLNAVVDGIEQHLADPQLSAEWLGAKLGLSERYVQHLVAETGVGFAQLVRRRRLEWARALLEERDAPPRRIVDIAYAVGFSDLSNFNRQFRQHFGLTPSDIRRHG
jgi:AraC-like DNA-binding protein